MNVSDQIANWLVSQGIEQVFAVTGGGAMFLNHAIAGHPQLHCMFMHHEQACAMAAEGYARISGKPAVVMTTSGPGAINALNGVFGAYTDSIPMIIISGQIKRETCLSFYDLPELRQLGDQEGPTIAMASPICKFAKLITSETDIETALPKAYHEAISGRPGPTWLDIPLDIQQSKIKIQFSAPDVETSVDKESIKLACKEIVKRLCESHKPLILAGTGVRLSNTQNRLLQLIEQIRVPLATAWTHDLIPSDHELFAGRPGTIGTRPGNFCLQSADFLLVLGSRLNIRQTSYNWESFAKNAWVAQVDVDRAELNKPTVKVDLGVEANLTLFFEILEEQISKVEIPNYQSWVEWCQKVGKRYNVAKEHIQKPEEPLNPYVVVRRVFQNLRSNDVIATGNASACILPFQIGNLEHGQRLFSNSGSASMGHDLPAALGAASAAQVDGNRRVICFAGDGSIQMNIQELQTLKTNDLNHIILIINNSGYLSIWQTHENFFGRVVGATPASGVEFPDFIKVALSYGIEAYTISTVDDLYKLDELLQHNGPLLIELIVDPSQEFAPRIKSRVDEAGKFITPELDDMHPFLSESDRDTVRAEAQKIRSS